MKEEIEQITERNREVETNKAWETSKTRRALIAIMTYVVVAIFLWSINVSHPWLNAIVPTAGFILSTLTLSFVKKIWLNHRR